MQSNAKPIDLFALSKLINTEPAIVTPDTLVIDAIALMANGDGYSNTSNRDEAAIKINNRQTDCVLVSENFDLLGILTPSDIIRLILSRNNLTQVKIAEVMTQQVVSLRQSQNCDIYKALQVMRHHGIRHLPIVDEQEQIIGIVTQDSLLQALDLQELQQHRTQADTCYDSQSQVNFQTNILDRVSDAVIAIDNEHRIIYLNQAAEQLYNINKNEFLGQKLSTAYDLRWPNPEDEQAVYDALLATNRWQGENIHRKNNGEEIFVESSVSVLKDNQGENIGLLTIIRDITKHKRVEIALQDKQQQLEAIAANIPVGIYRFIYHADGSLSMPYASVAYREILGLNPIDMKAYPEDVLATIHPDDREKFATALITTTLEEYQSNYVEYRARDVLGQVKWLGNYFRCFNHKNGDLIVDGIDIDITARKRAEIALQTSEARFRSLVEISSDWVWEVNEHGFFTYASSKVLDILGYQPQEILGKTLFDLMAPLEAQRLNQVINSFVAEKQPFRNLENINLHKDGYFVIVETSGVPIFDTSGEFRGYRGIDRDITERKQAEDALRRNKELYCSVVKSIYEGVVIQQADGSITSCNANAEIILGLSATQIKGRTSVDSRWHTIHEDGSPFPGETHPAMIALHTGKSCLGKVMGVYKPNGELTWILINSEPLFLPGETIPHAVVTSFSDITQRKEAEEKIAEQAQLLDITTDAILVKDLNGTILYCNRSAKQIYGWTAEETIGKTANELLYQEISPDLEEALDEVVETGSWWGELNKVTKEGKNIIVASRWALVRDKAGNPESILTVDTDITEKKQLENQFLRTQRLESLGTLASGIAHDLNNILTPILAIAQLLPLKLKTQDTDCSQMLSMLENSAKRGADLVKQILTFARGNEGKRTVLQVKHLLKDIEQFVKGTFLQSIAIQTNLPQDLLTVSADPTQIHQVLMNLVVNARDAMPNGGTITIAAQNLYIDESYAKMNLEAKVGSYVVITIADTGTGIPSEIIERVFDPFFTTKEVGKGTGLGLSSAIGIIKNHGGFIEVNSQVGKGSQFKVYLPSTGKIGIEAAQESLTQIGNSELIMVVDDEAAICEIIKTTLESQNFEIITAQNGIEAISSYVQYKNKINLVLIDMMMPQMDGATAIRTLQQLNSEIKIIAMSGLASTETLAQAAGTGIQGFLAKPFTKYDLLNTIEGVLKTRVLN